MPPPDPLSAEGRGAKSGSGGVKVCVLVCVCVCVCVCLCVERGMCGGAAVQTEWAIFLLGGGIPQHKTSDPKT